MSIAQLSNTERQIKLEEESLILGAKNYSTHRKDGHESETGPGRRLLQDALQPTAECIKQWVVKAKSGKAGRRHSAVRWIEGFDPASLAYLTGVHVINAVTGEPPRIQTVAEAIGTSVEEDINYSTFREREKGLYIHLQRELKKSTSSRHSRAVMSSAMRRTGMEGFRFPASDRTLLGMKLIELFIETTGWAEMYHDHKHGKRRERVLLRGTQELLEWLDRAHNTAAMFSPVRMPMVVPPLPWSGSYGGGYLTTAGGAVPLVRQRNRAYLRELNDVDMPIVYESVNTIQATPWHVNERVLEVVSELWLAGGGAAGLPERELTALPPKPLALVENGSAYKAENPKEFKAWKHSRACVWELNARTVSQRAAAAQKIALARRFASEDAIYFPYSLDFRGRVYPVPVLLNPQGDDLAKSLLRFARGMELGENGAFWLAVHIANLHGVDKVSFADRVQWVQDHEEAILDSAIDPLDGQRFWITADSPLCALAASIEWAAYKMHGSTYVSHLPIALDGSCNGLQNFSAMLRDEVGGEATNLTPRDTPADIYTEVIVVAERRLLEDMAKGVEEAAVISGNLTRALVKRPVMTLPYGVTRNGMRDQILVAMKEAGMVNDWGVSTYLAGVLWDCIGEVVIAARVAMDWLRDVAKVAARTDLPVMWTTPAGFPVLQEYRKPVGKRVRIHFGGRALQLQLTYDGTELNRRRQALGISPNFVHSCDASHLMLTTVLAKYNGVNDFAMIHDSYGTHAGNADVLATALRQAFVDQYAGDVLGGFTTELAAQLPPDSVAELPPLPEFGSLDINQVLEADYFFS